MELDLPFNKQEAKRLMKEGKKVRHRYFDLTEWVTMDNDEILLEDGVRCSEYEFWIHRNGPTWDEGWYLY